jgi:hypothetical protein
MTDSVGDNVNSPLQNTTAQNYLNPNLSLDTQKITGKPKSSNHPSAIMNATVLRDSMQSEN